MLPIRFLCIWLLAAALSAMPGALAQSDKRPPLENLHTRVTTHGEGSRTYRIELYDLSNDKYYGWLLEIRCMNCKEPYAYQEIVQNIPLRIFPEGSRYLVTEWASAVAEFVRIYYLGTEVRLVLDIGGRGGAQYEMPHADHGVPTVHFDYVNEPWEAKPEVHRDTWEWNGTEFVKTTRCLLNCR